MLFRSEQLDINTTQKVVKKVYDVINDCVESIELGSVKSSITGRPAYSNTVSDGQSINDKLQEELKDTRKKLISSNIGAMEEFTIEELERYTINELEGN